MNDITLKLHNVHTYMLYVHTFGCILCTVKCRCSLSDEPVRTICIGPSIPPCDCNQTSCEVNNFIHMYYI